jgi:hypothetical protein
MKDRNRARQLAPTLRTRPTNGDLWLVQPRAPTGWTLARLGEFPLVKREAARPAARWNDNDAVACGFGGSKGVAEVFFNITALQAQTARNRGHRLRLMAEERDEVLPYSHGSRRTSRAAWQPPLLIFLALATRSTFGLRDGQPQLKSPI